ncbi:hypothetical protein [Gordonia phthalatica]|uniref:Mammalian cell entry protein n=1 Tax=Gordonia phthalatica TaxID=1136941 RepID=A0A0N9N5W7_9ACTN|nr:hypothetical protein [Gordonia phthalatica]ALG85925.1 hypothetical protein ACH46_17320 [Gordonia phthalatica]
MVRPDHEDGEVLNSPDDAESRSEQPEQKVVRRSSPMARRKKSKAAKATPPVDETVETAAADDGTAADQDAADEPNSADDPDTVVDAGTEVEESEPAGDSASEPDAFVAIDAGTDEAETDEDGADENEAAAVEPDADELARNAEYRERRRKRAVVRKSATGRDAGDRSAWTLIAVASTAFLLVAGVVLSTVFGVQYYHIKKDRELRAEYSTFAQNMVVSMFTLNPDNADQMYKNVMANTSGRAKQMFQENMKNTAKMIREGDMVTKTTVLADAVSKATADEGSVLIVLDWTGHPKKDPKAAQSASFRLRVDITRINGEPKMTYLDWVA